MVHWARNDSAESERHGQGWNDDRGVGRTRRRACRCVSRRLRGAARCARCVDPRLCLCAGGPVGAIGLGRGRRAARGSAGRDQGPDRYGRPADRLRFADLLGPPPRARCNRRCAPARGWRRDCRQDGDDRVCLAESGADAQSLESAAHAGRVVERFGGCGRLGIRAAGAGHADGGLGDPAGGVLRRGRLQAELRRDRADRRARAGRVARPCRAVRALGR